MMNRRGALIAMSAAAFGAVPSSSALVRLLQSGLAQTQSPSSNSQSKDAVRDTADNRLRQDLARLAPHQYSEEGVPVFLACEDLVADKTSQKSTATPTAFNTSFASEFRETAEAWQRLHPDATDKDVAKVIEVLADRDFSNGGARKQ